MQRIWLWSFLALLSFFGAICFLPIFLFFYKSQIAFLSYDFASLTLLFVLLASLTLWKTFSVWRQKHFQKNNSSKTKSNSEKSFFAETVNQLVRKLDDERKAADRRAETAEEISRRVIEGLPSGLLVFDPQGFIKLSNPKIYELFRFPQPVEGVSFRKAFENLPLLQKLIQTTIADGKTFRSEIVADNDTSNRRQFGVTVAPLDSGGGSALGALCLLTDITEISQIREQLAVKQNLASLGEMAAGITHEFKNSLAAIQTYAQFWQTTENDPQRINAAKSLLTEVNNLSETVIAFLDFARPQKLSLSDADAEILISDAISELNLMFTELKISVSLRGDFGLIKCDEILLTRVFINLLKNAAESISAAEIDRSIQIIGEKTFDSSKCGWQTIKFQDSGAGIREEDLPFLFVPFFSTKANGHGVGLALAHRIVSEHGGSLIAENYPAGGAVLICKLPLAEVDEFPIND